MVGFARDAREERADVRLDTCFNFNNLNLNLVIFCLNINLSIWPKSGLKVIFHEIKAVTKFGECLNYKSGLRILIMPPEVPFFWSQRWALLAKVTVFGPQKMALLVAKSKF